MVPSNASGSGCSIKHGAGTPTSQYTCSWRMEGADCQQVVQSVRARRSNTASDMPCLKSTAVAATKLIVSNPLTPDTKAAGHMATAAATEAASIMQRAEYDDELNTGPRRKAPLETCATNVVIIKTTNKPPTSLPPASPKARFPKVANDAVSNWSSSSDASITRSATMRLCERSHAQQISSTVVDGAHPLGAVVYGKARNPPPTAVPRMSAEAPHCAASPGDPDAAMRAIVSGGLPSAARITKALPVIISC